MNDQSDHEIPDGAGDEATGWVDELGRRAGEAIRKPASADGLHALRTRQARRRTTVIAGAAAGTIALVVFAFVLVRRDDAATSPTVDTGPPPTASQTSASTPIVTSPTTSSVPAQTTAGASTTSQPAGTTLPGIPPQLVLDQLPRGDLDDFGRPARTIRFLPDGINLLVSPFDEATGDNHLIVDGETGEVLRSFAAASGLLGKPISPDGSRFFDGTTLWDLETATAVATVPAAGEGVFSPDGTWLAVIGFGGQSNQYQMVYAPTGNLVWSLPGTGNSISGDFWFSADSSHVYLAGPSFDVVTGASLPAAPARPPEAEPSGFAADGALVSELAGPYEICGARSTFIIGGAAGRADRCAISPDGSRIAMLVGDGTTVEVWTLEGIGR